jgi:aldose 1-epimerase
MLLRKKTKEQSMDTLKNKGLLILCMAFCVSLFNCKEIHKKERNKTHMENTKNITVSKHKYGTSIDGKEVDRYTLKNGNGMQVDIITYGGRITAISVPDKTGKFENVTLGFDRLELYEENNPYFGALVGRYGNRIAGAQFTLNGTTFNLEANNGPNSLHGGIKGFDKVVWQVTQISEGETGSLELNYVSKDMEEGFPGNLNVFVTYTLSNDNTIKVEYKATTDKTTIVNLTQHAYFNLSGDFSTDITNHMLQINGDQMVPIDENLIPTGELTDVAGTPFDFRSFKRIGRDIDADHDQIKKGGGYDHCWVLNEQDEGLRQVAVLQDPDSGRIMKVATTEPGIQFYTGNFLDGTLPKPSGGTYQKRSGLCLETQHYPDSPNQPNFPSVVLKPGETYSTTTTFTFSTN